MNMQRCTINIIDYEFNIHNLEANMGDVLVICIDESTPAHAEHLIEGIAFEDDGSETLCFETPLMTVLLSLYSQLCFYFYFTHRGMKIAWLKLVSVDPAVSSCDAASIPISRASSSSIQPHKIM